MAYSEVDEILLVTKYESEAAIRANERDLKSLVDHQNNLKATLAAVGGSEKELEDQIEITSAQIRTHAQQILAARESLTQMEAATKAAAAAQQADAAATDAQAAALARLAANEAADLQFAERLADADQRRATSRRNATTAIEEQIRQEQIAQRGAVDQILTHGRVADATDRAAKGTANLGYALLNAGRSVQDFQAAGLVGILNNIESLVMNLGGTAGLAGVLTAVAVGFQVLRPFIAEFFNSFQTGKIDEVKGSLAGLQAEIKRLTDEPHKLTIDYVALENAQKQLDQLKAGLDAFDAAVKARTSVQQQQAKQVQEALTEFAGGTDQASGAANLEKVIEDIRRRQGTFYAGQGQQKIDRATLEQQLQEAQRAVRVAELDPEADATIQRGIRDSIQLRLTDLVKKMDTAATDAIKAQIGQAALGAEAPRAELERLAGANRPAFRAAGIGPEFEAGLIAARRETVEAAKEEATLAEERVRDAKLIADRQKEEKDARGKLVDELNKLGTTYEDLDKAAIDQLKEQQDPETARRDREVQAKLRLRQREAQEKAAEAQEGQLRRDLGGGEGAQGDAALAALGQQYGAAALQVEQVRNPLRREQARAALDERARRQALAAIAQREPTIEPEKAAALAAQAPALLRQVAEQQLMGQVNQLSTLAQSGFAAGAINQQILAKQVKALEQQVNLLHRVRREMAPVGENFRDF